MWRQEQSASSPTDDSDLVADSSTSGHQKSYSHGSDQQWKQVVSSPTSMKGFSDSGKCSLYDSGRTDSGFLSGANLVSSECLSDEISPSRSFRDSSIHDSTSPEEEKESSSYMRLDSGVDVELNDQFSSLRLKNTSSLNNLNVSSKTKSHCQDANPFTNINVSPTATNATKTAPSPHPLAKQRHPSKDRPLWELYFKQDEDGDTQLHVAIVEGFIEVVYSLIRMVPNPGYLDILNDVCQTPLHLAVLTRQSRIVRRLLVAGAKVGIVDRNGNTALHLACLSGDMDCFEALTVPVTVAETDGANLMYVTYAQQVPQDFEAFNYDGQKCIHLAALGGHVETLRHLVWFGADVNARDGKSGRTALHYAVERDVPRVARFLLEECPVGPGGLHLETRTYAGFTARHLASYTDPALAQQLASLGARPHVELDESDSESDLAGSDDEVYQLPPRDNYFSHLRSNGEPINASA